MFHESLRSSSLEKGVRLYLNPFGLRGGGGRSKGLMDKMCSAVKRVQGLKVFNLFPLSGVCNLCNSFDFTLIKYILLVNA